MSGTGASSHWAKRCKFVNFGMENYHTTVLLCGMMWMNFAASQLAMVESDVISNCCWCSSNRKKSCASSLLVHASAEIEERRA